ncbi:hypothetical protein J6590_033041 [Homalodisca vitripennis]|nr:hypothetical protein J6590_033041 [Homalodisca vitripennis]
MTWRPKTTLRLDFASGKIYSRLWRPKTTLGHDFASGNNIYSRLGVRDNTQTRLRICISYVSADRKEGQLLRPSHFRGVTGIRRADACGSLAPFGLVATTEIACKACRPCGAVARHAPSVLLNSTRVGYYERYRADSEKCLI